MIFKGQEGPRRHARRDPGAVRLRHGPRAHGGAAPPRSPGIPASSRSTTTGSSRKSGCQRRPAAVPAAARRRAPPSTTSRSRARRCTTSSSGSRGRRRRSRARHEQQDVIVAVSEFATLVRSKAFIVGLLMMPVFMAIAFGVQKFTRNATDVKDRVFVVVDRTGVLYAPLKAAADDWNRAATGRRHADRRRSTCRRTRCSTTRTSRRAPRCRTASSAASSTRSSRSRRTRSTPRPRPRSATTRTIPGIARCPRWIGTTVNREIMAHRFRERVHRPRAGQQADASASTWRSWGCSSATPAARSRPRPRSTRSARSRFPWG